jgi:hypothetical protein
MLTSLGNHSFTNYALNKTKTLLAQLAHSHLNPARKPYKIGATGQHELGLVLDDPK